MTVMEKIRDFLAQKRIAIVGVSQQPRDFSRTLFRDFRKRGYEVVPVNPAVREIEGQTCFARVTEIQPPVSTVLLMTPPAVTDSVVRDCADAGVQRVWMYRAGGAGAVSSDAAAFCQSRGIAVIPGECPYMFLSGASWYHGLHGLVRKIQGAYPR